MESILAHIQNPDYYPTFFDQITHLVYSIAKFHIFNDGNKRSAILSGALFLSLNNCDKCMNLFIRGMEVPIIEAVTNHITKDELKTLLKLFYQIVSIENISKVIKMQICNVINNEVAIVFITMRVVNYKKITLLFINKWLDSSII